MGSLLNPESTPNTVPTPTPTAPPAPPDPPKPPDPPPAPPPADPPIPPDPPAPPDPPTPADPPVPPEPPKPKAPEKYDLKMAEGIALDAELMDEFSTLAKEADLPNEQAQKFVDLQGKVFGKLAAAAQAQEEARIATMLKETNEDKEIGGQELAQKIAIALKPIAKYGGPDLIKLLDETMLGSHKELIRVFYRIGLEMKEAGLIEGLPGSPPPGTAETFYPSMVKKK